MIHVGRPALVLAPMEGVTDAPMREVLGALGAFTYAVAEFARVSAEPLPEKAFRRPIPELGAGCRTPSGLLVQPQILGGDPERMALSAQAAVRAGAWGIDLNFGCPAPTVNRNDGGATLLKDPCRIRAIVEAVRAALPAAVPVSAKLRLGWDDPSAIDETSAMAAEGGASWLTIHARTRAQGYRPPVDWDAIGRVRRSLQLPIIANGDIWSLDDLRRCRDTTGCESFMLGRGALARPELARMAAAELGLPPAPAPPDWARLLRSLVEASRRIGPYTDRGMAMRLKQWLSLASRFGDYPDFDLVKNARTVAEVLERVGAA